MPKHTHHDLLELMHLRRDLLHLPRFTRLLHMRSRRHVLGVVIGVCLIFGGSAMAKHAHELSAFVPLPHLIYDALAYFIHGVGCMPLVGHIEPLWKIIMSE